jgi:FkbM family methyltransferase
MKLSSNWSLMRGMGKQAAGRLVRRVLPPATIRLAHVEPGTTLAVNLRRHVMFWSGGLDRFEPYSVRVLRAAIESGDDVLDIGANIGFYATLFSRWAGDEGRVLAIEPEPENLVLLRRNLAENGCRNTVVCDHAVGAERGTAQFSLDAATGATGRLGESATQGELAVGSGAVRLIATRVETVDDLVERHWVNPRVIKMDIEGEEIRALRGAIRTLNTLRPVIVSELGGDEAGESIAFLGRSDYQLWDLETGSAVAAGDRPFMIVALPAEEVTEERGRRVLEALASH